MDKAEVTLMYGIMLEAWKLFDEMDLGRMNGSGGNRAGGCAHANSFPYWQ